MIAKIIAWGRDRSESLQRMRQALQQSVIIGPTTNQLFLLQVLSDPFFMAGTYNTHFIDTHLPPEKRRETQSAQNAPLEREVAVVATVFLWWINQERRKLQNHVRPGFRNLFYRREFKKFKTTTLELKVEYQLEKPKPAVPDLFQFKMNISEHNFDVILERHSKLKLTGGDSSVVRNEIWCTINGLRRNYFVYSIHEEDIFVHTNVFGTVQLKHLPHLVIPKQSTLEMDGVCRAKMTGTIVSVAVSPGTSVLSGDIVVVMESMKMESRITSPQNGVVEEVFVKPGQVVEGGQTLLSFQKQN